MFSLSVLSLTLLVFSWCYPSHTSSYQLISHTNSHTECSHSYSHTTCSLTPTHSYSHRVFSLILTHVLPITVIPVVLTLTSLVFSQSVLTHSLTECSLRVFSFTPSHQLFSLTHVIPDTLSQSVLTHTLTPTHSHQLTHTLTECSHTTCSHSHMLSLILSHRVFSHNSPPSHYPSHPHTHTTPHPHTPHTHHTHNDLSSTSHYTLVAPLDPPYHPNQFNQEDGINLKDSLDKASSYPHSTHFILSRLQKIAKTIPFHSIPYKSFSFTQKESSILT